MLLHNKLSSTAIVVSITEVHEEQQWETDCWKRPVNSKISEQAVDKIPSDEEIDLWTTQEGRRDGISHRKAKSSLRKLVPTFLYSSFFPFYHFFPPWNCIFFRAEWKVIWSNFLTFWMRMWKFIEIWLTQSCHQLESKSTSEQWLLAPSQHPFNSTYYIILQNQVLQQTWEVKWLPLGTHRSTGWPTWQRKSWNS